MSKKSFIFLIIFLIVFGFLIFNFRKTKKVEAEKNDTGLTSVNSLKIIKASVEPTKVWPGDTMNVTAEIEDNFGIKEVTADMGQIETINLKLKRGDIYQGIWEARWLVHDVEVKTYITRIEATNILNQKAFYKIEWSDDPDSATFYPVADSYVEYRNPDNNYGASAALNVTWAAGSDTRDRRSFLKFDISSIPSGSTINSASLNPYHRINPWSGWSWVDLVVHKLTDDTWGETTITWNNQPAYGVEADRRIGGGSAGTWDIFKKDYIKIFPD